GASTIVDNVGNVKGYGLEGSMQYSLSENFDFALTGAWTDTEASNAQLACPDPVDENACEGTGLGHVPDFAGSARFSAHYPVQGGNVRASFELWGQTKTGALGFSVDPDEVIGSYAELAIRLGYRSDNGWGITGYVENLTNVTYVEGIFNGELMFPPASFNPSRPRTFGVRFTASFGGG
ncbi:MAG: TonB-dependent receptor, partial [Sphingomonadales bacterium]